MLLRHELLWLVLVMVGWLLLGLASNILRFLEMYIASQVPSGGLRGGRRLIIIRVLAEWLTQRFSVSPRLPLRFHLEAGLFELGHDGQSGIRDTTRHLRDVLLAKGYVVSHREYSAAHGYEHWRVSFAEGILALIRIDTTSSYMPRSSCT